MTQSEEVEIGKLLDRRDARIAQLTAALKAVEWDQNGECLNCGQPDHLGHNRDCIVGKALEA